MDLDANGSAEVRFPLAAPRAGQAKVALPRAAAAAPRTGCEITREVKAPLVLEAVALYGETTHESAEKLGDLSAIRDDVGGLDVSLASTALVGLGGGVEQLVEYPYGCTEQLTSRLVPLLPLRDLAPTTRSTLPADVDRAVAEDRGRDPRAPARRRRLRPLGRVADSEPLGDAPTRSGASVAEAARRDRARSARSTSATRYLRAALLASSTADPYRAGDGAVHPRRARRARRARPGPRDSALRGARRAPALRAGRCSSTRWSSARATPESIEKLAGEIEGALRLDANVARAVANVGDQYAVLMDSETRTSALVLRALLAARPDHPLARAPRRWACSRRAAAAPGATRRRRRGRSSRSTTTARRRRRPTPDFTAHVFLGERRDRERRLPRPHRSTSPDVGAGGAPRRAPRARRSAFTVDGQGQALLRGAPPLREEGAAARGDRARLLRRRRRSAR